MPSVAFHNSRDFTAAWRVGEIRWLIGSVGFYSLSSRALAVIIGFQIYHLTHSVLALGWLGLVEAIPAICLAPFGGYVADHFNRRKVLLFARAVSIICTLALALLAWRSQASSLWGFYSIIFLAGVARGFADPAGSAFEAQVVPKPLTVNASSWISSTWITCSVIGPGMIGFVFDAWGGAGAFLLITGGFVLAWVCTRAIAPKPQTWTKPPEAVFESIRIGWRYLFGNQPLVAAMALDLFSVFFGGAVILLPVYAHDILRVGATGLGLLNAAPALGALVTMLWATRRPPIARPGRNLLWAVAGFGVAIVIFAFSKSFLLSLAALFFSGAFDGISVVIRRSLQRLLSPEHLRGRIAAAGSIFICASNELGAFESGMLAAWIGTVPCVAVGGLITLGVVGLTAKLAPKLRSLRFNPETLEPEDAAAALTGIAAAEEFTKPDF